MNPEELMRMLMGGDSGPSSRGIRTRDLHRHDKDDIKRICDMLKEIWKISKLNTGTGIAEIGSVAIENGDGKVIFHQRLYIDLYTLLNKAQFKDVKENPVPMDEEMARLYKHCKANHDYFEAQREMEEAETKDVDEDESK